MIRLIFSGKALADENTIESYNMKAGDTIHMILQLKGGFWAMKLVRSTIRELNLCASAVNKVASMIILVHNRASSLIAHCISAIRRHA